MFIRLHVSWRDVDAHAQQAQAACDRAYPFPPPVETPHLYRLVDNHKPAGRSRPGHVPCLGTSQQSCDVGQARYCSTPHFETYGTARDVSCRIATIETSAATYTQYRKYVATTAFAAAPFLLDLYHPYILLRIFYVRLRATLVDGQHSFSPAIMFSHLLCL